MTGKMIRLCGYYSVHLRRHLSTTSAMWQQQNQQHNEESKIKGYLMNSYMRYMNNYEQMLEKRFPAAMKVYRIFTYGIKNFYNDLKTFVNVRLTVLSLTKEEGFTELTRREIELYEQMPKDMLKITPVLLFSALPFANYVVFPLAYMYPRIFLTSHFWTDDQKEEFNFIILKERLKFNKPLFKNLQHYSKNIQNPDLKIKFCDILDMLEKGTHPTVEQIIDCKTLFITGPYSIRNLHFTHRRSLLRLHGLSNGLHPSSKLKHKAFILKEMDKAIVREGGLQKMSWKELKAACFIRGFQASRLTQDEVLQLLEKWLSISNVIDKEAYSLLLHGPIVLGYNLPYHLPQIEDKK